MGTHAMNWGVWHMHGDSMIYTIGTALNRARDNDSHVDVLVDGTWIGGRVLAVDGFGVVLRTDAEEHSVVRVESVSAVTVRAAAPPPATLAGQLVAAPGRGPGTA